MNIPHDIPENISVASIAINFPAAPKVLRKHNIDFCCGGNQPFEKACIDAGIAPEVVWSELTKQTEPASHVRALSWSLPFLVDYIIFNHHDYVKKAIPEIIQLIDTVVVAHGQDHPQVLEIKETFATLAADLSNHMGKEEHILFPAVKSLYAEPVLSDGHGFTRESIHAPISVMEHEHDEAGHLIKKLRKLTHDYSPPQGACPTWQITYKKLQEFDEDLTTHIMLENHILFEKIKKP